MKRMVFYLLLAATVAFCLWLIFYRIASGPKQPLYQQNQPSAKPLVAPQSTTNAGPPQPSPEAEFRRPAGIDDEGWRYLKMVRQLALTANQPIEFYARTLDQEGKPVDGAKLKLTLSYVDEEMFRGTNFFHMKMGDEIRAKMLVLTSDSNGWVKLSGVKGQALRVESLEKEGFSWTMPQIDMFGYESGGKHSVGYTEMESAFNPDQGYIFHLQKIVETNSVK